MSILHVNIFAVLLSGIVCMILGTVWYSNVLFAKQWNEALGKKMEEYKPNPILYIGVFALFVATAFVFGKVLYYARISDLMGSIQLALLAWFGFTASTIAVNYLFENKPKKLYLINAGYHLANILAISIVMGLWK